jgi:predicted RNA binding protein YcfA (HicA-like mRNA interferase family)
MNRRKFLQRIMASPANVRFADMTNLVEGFGFTLIRISGSHHIFGHPDIAEQINLQKVGAEAKPYQIRQVLRLVERYNLQLQE